MNELGAFDEPGIDMGYLSAQALRAARIVVDIGMHLGYTDFDGKVWNAESSRKLQQCVQHAELAQIGSPFQFQVHQRHLAHS